MSAYQNFLDFFSMHNKERLDGLNEIYFTGMTQQERAMAFNYLLKMVEAGGSEESVNGLFLADANHAQSAVTRLLSDQVLRDEAKIAAAWNLFRIQPDDSLISVFIELMSSGDKRIRAKAAYYVPAESAASEVIAALEGMIRTETDTLASINAVNKLLECYGVTRDSVDKDEFSIYYRNLRSDDLKNKEQAFKKLDLLHGSKKMS